MLVNAMHITASVFINDDESGLHRDYAAWLETLAPFDASPTRYAHNRTGEDNADAHMKRQIMGREVVVAITGGRLDFGPWEQIFYGEFDGRAGQARADQGDRRVAKCRSVPVPCSQWPATAAAFRSARRKAAASQLPHAGRGDHRGVVGGQRRGAG